MYSETAFQTRGLWPSTSTHFQSHHRALAYDPPTASPLSPLARYKSQVKRTLTPPRDMQSVAQNYHHMSARSQEQGTYYVDNSRRPYSASNDSSNDSSMSRYSRAPASKLSSPTLSHQSFTSNTSQQQRQPSQASTIAPFLQIPKTVNNSQGSLSELAAQVTCLFWFESSAVLDFAEDMFSEGQPLPVLKRETSPSSGFRKWVTTLISTTQVAQNVIILALLFIYRLKRQNPSVQGKEGSEYRLLTVALMLGNKFLDDNTYTNKTWADVSGISVTEVHIMEVEFLSNMKYNLFTSAEQWAKWQSQLGRFSRFLERASQLQTLPNPQSLPQAQPSYGHMSLPSPPASFQASPPRIRTPAGANHYFPPLLQAQAHTNMIPSPLASMAATNSRKRSLEDGDSQYHPAKRAMHSTAAYPSQQRPHRDSVGSTHAHAHESFYPSQQYPSSMPVTPADGQPLSASQLSMNRLPPLTQHIKTPATSAPSTWQSAPTSLAQVPNAMATALQSARSSRNHSPYLSSTNVSPTNSTTLPVSHHSPSFFLSQRDSPYKAVRKVHTLLVPPPSRAMHQPEHVGNNQMHYQPLGRPQERQTGRLPYIQQNQWFDHSQKVATPVEQWSDFIPAPHQPQGYRPGQMQQSH